MAGANVEGPVGALVTDALKRVCTRCNGVKFMINDQVTSPGAGESLAIHCVQCGYEQALDLETDCGALENYSD